MPYAWQQLLLLLSWVAMTCGYQVPTTASASSAPSHLLHANPSVLQPKAEHSTSIHAPQQLSAQSVRRDHAVERSGMAPVASESMSGTTEHDIVTAASTMTDVSDTLDPNGVYIRVQQWVIVGTTIVVPLLLMVMLLVLPLLWGTTKEEKLSPAELAAAVDAVQKEVDANDAFLDKIVSAIGSQAQTLS